MEEDEEDEEDDSSEDSECEVSPFVYIPFVIMVDWFSSFCFSAVSCECLFFIQVTSVKTKEELLREKIKEHIDLQDSEEEETTTLTSV